MSQQFDAIYDDGVFKPLTPLSLPDKSRVKLTVETRSTEDSAVKLAGQKAALRKCWAELDQLPQVQNGDGWSARQHDDLLYGSDG